MSESRTTELVHVKWFLGQALALLSLWTVAGLDLARGPVLFAVFLVTAAVTLFPRLPALVRPPLRRFAAPLLVVVFLVDLLFAGRDIIPPMVRLLLVLLAVRVASHRSNREDLQLILLGMFLSVVSGVFTLSMLFAVQAFLFALLAIGLLYVVNLLESAGETAGRSGEWARFTWKEFAGYARRSFHPAMIRSLALLFVLLIATTAILFVAIPRVHLDKAIPFLRVPQAGLSGFSDIVRFGDVTRIQEDDGIAMQIDVPDLESLPDDPYWRMLVLDRYENGAFASSLFGSGNRERSSRPVHVLSPFPDSLFAEPARGDGSWTFYLEPGVSRYLPILGPFEQIRFQGRQPFRSDPQVLVFSLPRASASVFSYQVRDFRFGPGVPASALDEPLLAAEEAAREEEARAYPLTTLALPLEREEREFLRARAAEILGERRGRTPVEMAGEIAAYLGSRHSYTLSPGSFDDEGDPIIQWLESERPGHCELFAGGFAVLARAAGIPTRMVVGFNGGSWNSYEDYFVVRNRNAHAWCEIFDGSAWVRIDPTPGGSGGGSNGGFTGSGAGFAHETGFQAWIESLRVMWYRRVINFDDASQEEFVEGVSTNFQRLAKDLRRWVGDLGDGVAATAGRFGRILADTPLAWIPVVLLLAGGFLLIRWLARHPRALWSRSSRRSLHPLRRRAGRELRRLDSIAGADEAWSGERALRDELRQRLLAVRFGRDPEPSEAFRLFRRTRRFARRRRSGARRE
ncbi:MAG: transglutaminaseTgpA domain-containing protein [Puniceicoccaceae bacterium]